MSGFHVLAERCGECLYGRNKIVPDQRRKEILRKIERTDGHFICHKASIAGVRAACHGDWQQRGCGQVGQIAGRLGLVVFVAEADLPSLPKDERLDDEDTAEDDD